MTEAARLLELWEMARHMEPCRTEEQAHQIIRSTLEDIQHRMTQDKVIQNMIQWLRYGIVPDDYELKPKKPCYAWVNFRDWRRPIMLFKDLPVMCLKHKELDDLVRHEFAHAYLAYTRKGEKIGHEKLWVDTAKRFGGSGNPKGFD